ncbi:MAG: YifB family Mg chelatase-like AAA ATPase [Phycisphaerae bacterium]|nr:YifB family Mg chelatase-like AAA ATPase [Phycisphaerae bacterium]
MLARVQSYLLQGIDALSCEVEVDHTDASDVRRTVVGLPDAAVKESLERVSAGLANSGYEEVRGRLLVNLAPADVRKEGPLYDLPIAIAILMGRGVVRSEPDRRRYDRGAPPPPDEPGPGLDAREYLVAGELALDGRVRPVRGVIAMAALAKSLGRRGVIVPAENAPEAAVVPGVEAIGVRTLAELVGLLNGGLEPRPYPTVDAASLLCTARAEIDFADVRGQENVKRAITVAAAGAHNLLMLGPAGTGKSMMAKALPGVLPPMTPEEAVEVTRVYSAAGKLEPGSGLVAVRPVRSPHHTASGAAIIGGGIVPRPGEVSLAHRGVLFLDELPEFPRFVLETLRQPLEDHVVTVARSHSAVRFPADFMLVAAMNPTPKGDVAPGEFGRREMDRYLARLSGPLLDRIDLHVEAPAVPFAELSAPRGSPNGGGARGAAGTPRGTSSAAIRARVLQARAVQIARQGPVTPNARLSGRQLDELAPLGDDARALLGQAMSELGLSARAYDKIRRVARTLADLEEAETITVTHVAEAVSYRLLDRKA